VSSNIIDTIYICMHIHTHIHIHICAQPAASVFADVYVGVKLTCVTYTPAHALVPKTPVPKCMQHSLQEYAHIYILTHISIRIHMHTNTLAHARHHPHAEALIMRPTIYAQICIHIHIHVCINAYIYIYIHTCIYIHIYVSAHIHTYTYIHTHIQNVHIHAHKHAWNDGVAATTQGADEDAGSFARVFHSMQSITFSTSNARTSLYPLPETPIPLNPPSPLPNISQNSLQTTHLGRT